LLKPSVQRYDKNDPTYRALLFEHSVYVCIVNWDKVVGDNIRDYRMLQKLSQEALAVKANMSSNYLGEVERGKETISVRRIVLVAKALKIAPHLLLIPESYREKLK
jgi:hypothetical protein